MKKINWDEKLKIIKTASKNLKTRWTDYNAVLKTKAIKIKHVECGFDKYLAISKNINCFSMVKILLGVRMMINWFLIFWDFGVLRCD